MKETGIIMSGAHPKLILDGIKTMTRRVVKPQPDNDGGWDACNTIYDHNISEFCPYGQVGDRLWVRETFCNACLYVCFKADPKRIGNADCDVGPTWKPSIHMFRNDSRITLEITDIRVERLQEIAWEDALKEGIESPAHDLPYLPRNAEDSLKHYLVSSYRRLWGFLNARRGYGWESNPWVWVISFRRINDN